MILRSVLMVALSTSGAVAHARSVDDPPTAPGNPSISIYSPTLAEVRWERSRDDRGAVVGYEILRDGVGLGTFDALSYVDRDLRPGRDHEYTILAVDSAGQRSPRASVRAGASGAVPDAAPSPPAGVRADVYSRTAAELFWERSATPGQRYEVVRDGTVVTTTDGTSYFDGALTATRPYRFEVISLNRRGERSAPVRLSVDTTGDAATPGPVTGPAAPAGLRASSYSRTVAEVFWDRPATSGLAYDVRRDGELLATTRGTSWFDDALAGGASHTYEIVAVDSDGRRSAASSIVLSAPGAGGGPPDDGDDLPMPEAFRDVETVADTAPFDAIERVDIDASRPDAAISEPSDVFDYELLAATPGASTPDFLLRRYLTGGEDDRHEFLRHDPDTGGIEVLTTRPTAADTTFSRDLSTVAWNEGCSGYVQRLDDGSAPVLVNSRLYADTCLRDPTLSDDGEVVVYESAFVAGGSYGPLVHVLANGSTTSFGGDYDVALDDADLTGVDRVYTGLGTGDGSKVAIAADGSRVFMRTEFRTGRQRQPATSDIVVGTIVVDTATASAELVGRHGNENYSCESNRCGRSKDVVVSGDGRYVFFMRPVGGEPLNFQTPARLYRHDVERGETVRVPVDDVPYKSTLTTDADGSRVAYMSARGAIVLRLDTGERLLLDRTLRGCDASGCTFDGYYSVKSDPLTFAADGSVLLLSLILEGNVPRNTLEILVLDVDARAVRQAAPGADVNSEAVSDDGRTFALSLDTYQGDGRYDDGTDLLVIRR